MTVDTTLLLWESNTVNIQKNISRREYSYELRQPRAWFDEECTKLLDHREQVTLQCFQNHAK
jgi:hypothetical protein